MSTDSHITVAAQTCTHLVIPYLDDVVVSTGDDVRFVTARVVVHAVHAFLVTFQREIWRRGTQLPHLWKTWFSDIFSLDNSNSIFPAERSVRLSFLLYLFIFWSRGRVEWLGTRISIPPNMINARLAHFTVVVWMISLLPSQFCPARHLQRYCCPLGWSQFASHSECVPRTPGCMTISFPNPKVLSTCHLKKIRHFFVK